MTEKLTPEQKNDLKQLLDEFSKEISELNNQEIKNKLDNLKSEIPGLNQENIKDFLKNVKAELNILKDYAEYKNIVGQLESKIEEIEKEILNPTKDELSKLQQNIKKIHNIEDLSPEEIKNIADINRKKHAKHIEWIVEKLAQRNDWIWKIAKKAMW